MTQVGSLPGFIREATVKYVDVNRGTMRIALNLGKTDTINNEFSIPIPAGWTGPSGEFSGGYPEIGATIWVAQGAGNRWAALMYVPSTDVIGTRNLPLKPGRWITQTKNNIQLYVDKASGVTAGSPTENIQIDPNTVESHRSIISARSKQNLGFTDASRNIDGPVRRDKSVNSNRNITGSALDSHVYDDSLSSIGLDPLYPAGIASRNPQFNEVRHVVYEFGYSYGFTNDGEEVAMYDNSTTAAPLPTKFPRRQSRADVLSLSLEAPNYLTESIQGTVIDIYGNILDLNRAILPSGTIDSLSFASNSQNKSDTFIKLREQDRKSIVYHYEMNARKASVPDNNSLLPPVTGAPDYARDRSRLFIDVDKEGQFKINIPSSSEIGNIGLLTRYENYSTLLAAVNNGNPNEFVRNVDNQDIFIEGFGVGVIGLTGGDQSLDGYASPTDRVKNIPIKLGTAYHNLQQTLQMQNRGADDPSLLPIQFDPDSKLNNRAIVPLVGDIVTPNIIVSGNGANAGGRSGTISMDGFVSLNIGANSVDRQSLWLDAAGGIVTNIGRDINNRSWQGRFDGDIFVQIGGSTVGNDSRFMNLNNANRDGTLDLRVVVNSQMTIIRIDSSGVRIATPGELDIESAGTLRLKSKSDVIIDGKGIYFYSDGTVPRWVQRNPGMTI